jgi:hypothetical protein
MSVAPKLRRWRSGVLALLPLLAWIVWQLRDGALGPIPMLVYVTPTALVWCGALGIRRWVEGRWHVP